MACQNFKSRLVSMHDEQHTPMAVCQNCGDLPEKHEVTVQKYGGFEVNERVIVRRYNSDIRVGEAIIKGFIRKKNGIFVVFDRNLDFGDAISRDAHITCIMKYVEDDDSELEEYQHVSDIANRIWGRLSAKHISDKDVQSVLDVLADILKNDT